MEILGPATEAEMVLVFLRAELDSATYPGGVNSWLAQHGLDSSLIEQGDSGDENQNAQRELVLGASRGFKGNQMLFTGFPDDVEWSRAVVTPNELSETRYTSFSPWPELGGRSLVVSHGAASAANEGKLWIWASQDPSPIILAIAKEIEAGRAFEPVILVGPEGASAPELVLLEGYKRATAYALVGGDREVDALIGATDRLSEWTSAIDRLTGWTPSR